jgi:alkylated DNA repair protein alkB family protein 6
MVREDLPEWLERCCKKIAELGVFGSDQPNHVLVNEYTPGQGIMPHEDGPLYTPVVTTISLGSTALLDFYRPIEESRQDSGVSLQERYITSILLEPRSLVVLTEDLYIKYLHGIEARTSDPCTTDICNLGKCAKVLSIGSALERQTRVSLTIRHVPKVIKFNLLHHVLGKRANQ